jgi:DNA-binding FadR family transcriptional regulator
VVAKPPPREKPQRIADEIRALIVSGQLADGDLVGREPELVERFGVSRPSLREALRILEVQGLISVVRGVLGGSFARRPDETLAIVAGMLTEIVASAVAAASQNGDIAEPVSSRRRSVRSQRRLVELIAAGDGPAAEAHWRAHMVAVGRVILGDQAADVVDVVDHY